MKIKIDMNNNVYENIEIAKKFLIDNDVLQNHFFDFDKQKFIEKNVIDFDNYCINEINNILYNNDVMQNKIDYVEIITNNFIKNCQYEIHCIFLYYVVDDDCNDIEFVKMYDCDVDLLNNNASNYLLINLLNKYNKNDVLN